MKRGLLLALLCLACQPVAGDTVRDYPITVTNVHDGDTVTAVIDLGFHLSLTTRIRLASVDTWELSQPLGTEARDYLASLLKDKKNLTLRTNATQFDNYGRALGHILVSGTDTSALMRERYQKQPQVQAGP